MRHELMIAMCTMAFGAVALAAPQLTIAHPAATETAMQTHAIRIPESVRAEHKEIHSTLVEATRAPGQVGTAARQLAEVLDPHFAREEQIALPPLGLLAPLAAGTQLPKAVVSEALSMTDSLRAEMPRMLEEHKAIHAAVEKLRLAAQAEHATKYERLAEQLSLHAQTEEQVLYPAALLVGDILRSRSQGD